MGKICNECGQELPGTATVCDLCGATLPTNAQPDVHMKYQNSISYGKPESTKPFGTSSHIRIISIVACIVIVGLVALYINLFGFPQWEKTQSTTEEERPQQSMDTEQIKYLVRTLLAVSDYNAVNFDEIPHETIFLTALFVPAYNNLHNTWYGDYYRQFYDFYEYNNDYIAYGINFANFDRLVYDLFGRHNFSQNNSYNNISDWYNDDRNGFGVPAMGLRFSYTDNDTAVVTINNDNTANVIFSLYRVDDGWGDDLTYIGEYQINIAQITENGRSFLRFLV